MMILLDIRLFGLDLGQTILFHVFNHLSAIVSSDQNPTKIIIRDEKSNRDFKNNVPKNKNYSNVRDFPLAYAARFCFSRYTFRNPKITQCNRHLYLK